MRIQLSLDPAHFARGPVAGPSSGPLAQLGGEVVLIELQGELGFEAEEGGGVVGVIGLERPDKPTLHLGQHHLLHGKFVSLPKPLAVIRRATTGSGAADTDGGAVQGDAYEEEEDAIIEDDDGATGRQQKQPKTPARQAGQRPMGSKRKNRKNGAVDDDDDDDEAEGEGKDGPLFPPDPDSHLYRTPLHPRRALGQGNGHAASSSPILPPSSVKDWSSELDFSSPAQSLSSRRSAGEDEEDEEEDGGDGVEGGKGNEEEGAEKEDEDEVESEEARRKRMKLEAKRAERRALRPQRTKVYEVVGLVRRKVVFSLRPEPIVTATILPE